MALLIGAVLVVAAVLWMVLSGVKRNRQQRLSAPGDILARRCGSAAVRY